MNKERRNFKLRSGPPGPHSNSVFADNRKAAASLLHCSVEHVKFVKQVRRTELQRSGDHCAKLSISLW